MRGPVASALRRAASGYAGRPANRMNSAASRLHAAVTSVSTRRSLSVDMRKRAISITAWRVIGVEASALRFGGLLDGPESGLPRGWDDGLEDDDGG